MPSYEYHCSNCGHDAEIFQKIAEAPLKSCPECGKDTFERLISQSSFALRGSGWYADGYGAKPDKSSSESTPKKTGGGDKSEAAPKPADAGTKTEKPEPKPAPKPSSGSES